MENCVTSVRAEPIQFEQVHIFFLAVHLVLIIRSKVHFGCSLDFPNVLPGSVIGILYAPCVAQRGARKICRDLPGRRL